MQNRCTEAAKTRRDTYAYVHATAMLVVLAVLALLEPAQAAPPRARLEGRAGAYHLQTPDEVRTLAADGFDLVLLAYQKPNSPMAQALTATGVKYIDNIPAWTINAVCGRNEATQSCVDERSGEILDRIRQHFIETANDPNIIAYWILDDYPRANVKSLLRQVHASLAQVNATASVQRPAICGMNDIVTVRTRGAPPPRQLPGFERALTNFDPQACDYVALYPYTIDTFNDRRSVDWSLSAVLPLMLDRLRSAGWDPQREPLIGMPQAFAVPYPGHSSLYFPLASADDIALQTESYCKAGAVAILAYAWDDSYKGEKHELYNTPSLVDGLKRGTQICRNKYWRH